MTGLTRSSHGLDARRRRLLYRAWHRGMREMDLILGPFAEQEAETLSEAELDAFEALLELPDDLLLAWVSNARPVAPEHDTPLFVRIVEANAARHRG